MAKTHHMYQIDFISDQFLPYLPEDCQSNPGAYGFELAQWLSEQLMKRGIVTGYPLGEDWGWLIEYLDGETEIIIGCGSETGEGEGYQGKPIPWRIFLRQSFSLTQRLKGTPYSQKVRHLADTIVSLLEAEGIDTALTDT